MPSPQTSVSTPIDTTTKKEEEEEEVESWNQETTSTNNSNRVVVPSTKSTVTTLHFQSGLSLPVSGTSRTREQVLKNNTTTATTTTTTTTLLHEVPSFHILKDEQRKKKAMKAVLESKTAASQALSSPTTTTTLEPLANAEQELLKHVRLIFPSALQIFNNNTNTTLDAELITLDPDFLVSSNHTIFLRMANTIIQKEQQKINNNKKSNGVFLKEKRLEQSSFHDWPQWFKKCCLTSSLSISSLLLAAIEVSIYKSYIQEKNKQQHKKKNNNTPKQKVLPELTLDPLHHHVTNHSLPSLLQSWSRLHGLKNLSHGSAANVRQLVRQLISMSHADQRQRGAMTAANSFHIDDLLLVSLPFFFFFTSFCDYSPTTTTNCHPANEPLQRWNGVIAQGKDYVTQLLKKLDLEEIALTKNSQKNNNNNNNNNNNIILDHNTVSANMSAKENTQKTKDNNNNSNEGESSKNNNNNDTTTTTSEFKNGSSGSGTPQENSKQSSSKKKKKNKKKKVRSR